MNDFKKLKIWARAHALTLHAYRATRTFPKEEAYGVTSQIRRASASIPANIAEGYGRYGDAELARFLSIAAGSACELEYHLLLSKDLGYLKPPCHAQLDSEVSELKRMLSAFLSRLKAES